jgi:hypothetical protein
MSPNISQLTCPYSQVSPNISQLTLSILKTAHWLLQILFRYLTDYSPMYSMVAYMLAPVSHIMTLRSSYIQFTYSCLSTKVQLMTRHTLHWVLDEESLQKWHFILHRNNITMHRGKYKKITTVSMSISIGIFHGLGYILRGGYIPKLSSHSSHRFPC